MPQIDFDTAGALKAGASPSQIADYLAQQTGFDIGGARKAGASDDQIISHLAGPLQQQAPAPKDRTWGEATTDTGIGLAKGVVGVAKLVPMTIGAVDSFVSNAFGLGEPITGGAFENVGTKALNRAEEYLQSKKSATIQAKEQNLEQNALAFGDKFANDGTIARIAAEFGYKFANSFTDPALLLQGVSENVASITPAGFAARGAQIAATRVAPRVAAQLSKEAVETAARRIGVAAGVTTGAVQQGADVASGAYDQMMKMDESIWQRRQDYVDLTQQIGADKAKSQIAGQLATEAGVRSGLASLVVNGLGAKFGGAALESAFLKRGASEVAEGGLKGALKVGAKGALGETVTESLEEGYGAYAKNTAAQQVDETIDPYRGVGSAAGAGGVLGAVLGGGVGAVRGYAGERPAAPPPAAPPPAVNPTDAALNQAVDNFDAARRAYLDPGVASDAVTSAPSIDEAINTATAIAAGGTSSLAQAVGERAKGAQLAAAMDRQAELAAQANAAPTAFDRQNAVEQSQVALDALRPAPAPGSNVVEDLFASEMQANQRLVVLRDEAAQAGQDPARLTVQPSPAAEGRFQIVAVPEPVAQTEAAPAPTPAPFVEQRLNAAANEGMMQAYLRQRDILDRGQALGSQLAQDLLPGDQQAFKQAYENVANRGGVASPKEAAVLDRMSPNERLYDSVEGKPPALKAAELPTTLPTAQQQAVDAAQSEGIARRMGLTDNAEVPGTVETPALIVPEQRAPARQRQDVPQMQAEIANTLRENANEVSMMRLEQQAQQKQAQQDAAIEAMTPPAQQAAPEANRVIAAYKKIPALRTAEDKAVVDSALRTYAPEDLRILRDTAEAPFRLSTTDRIRLGELRQSTAGIKTSEQRAAEATEQPAAQAEFTVAEANPTDLKTLPQQSQANTGELSQQSHRFLKSLASVFGKKLVIFESTHPKAVDGYVINGSPNTIYLNRNSQKSHLVVFGHELMHLLKMTEPTAYAAIRNVVKLRAEEQGRFDTTQGIRGDFEELISDLQGDLFADTTFWVDVFREVAGKQNDKVVIRLGATLVRAVDRFIKALKSVATFDSSAMVANMGEVRSAIQTALATYATSQKGQAQALYREERDAANQESQQAGVQGERQAGDQVGAPAEAGVGNRVLGDEEIPAAEGQGRQGVRPPTKAEMAARRARQEMGMRFSEQRDGRIDNVEAYHFSKAPRKILNSNSYGSNYAGSGREQYLRARDERRRQRIYFYFDKGTGVRPEAGVGGYAHKANLNNVYDINKDPLGLRAGTQDQTETNILDAGFNGYLDRMEGTQSGQVIMLGKQDIPVQPLPPGTRVQSGAQYATPVAQAEWSTRATGTREQMEERVARMRSTVSWRGYDIRIVPDVNGAAVQVRPIAEPEIKASDKRALPGAPDIQGATGPDPALVAVAEQYARANGIALRRQSEYVDVDEDRARRIAAAYDAMPHAPQDPKVREAYANLIRQTVAQYKALQDAGYKFWFIDTDRLDNAKYAQTPWNAMRDIRANKQMGVFPSAAGFGSGATEVNVEDNPLLQDTGFTWPVGGVDGALAPVLANDLFRAVHDAFGHGIEGAGFRARGEENAWQAHVRLFTGSAVAAITTETRGQNSWLNYGPYGLQNRNAKVEDTVFADQKTGLMPEWTWQEGLAGDMVVEKEEEGAIRASEKRNDVLTRRLAASGIRTVDDFWRRWQDLLIGMGVQPSGLSAQSDDMSRQDRIRQSISVWRKDADKSGIKPILRKYGFPAKDGVGKDGLIAAAMPRKIFEDAGIKPTLENVVSAYNALEGQPRAANDAPYVRQVPDDFDNTPGVAGFPRRPMQGTDWFTGEELTEPDAENDIKFSAKRPVRQEVADAADISRARQIATSQTWATNRDFKLALQQNLRNAARTVDLRQDTPEMRRYITRQILKEAREALVSNSNAVGWYDEKVTTALEVVSTIHPELKTDQQSRFAFIWALAVTSNGVKVNKNFELAERAYRQWKASDLDPAKRRMPTSGIGVGTAAGKIHEGLATYNDLSRRWGYERMRAFATTLQANRDVKTAYGRAVSGEGMDTQVYGAGILGPKIGNGFFMNLFGEFGQLTMDRWWVRMWGRMTGDLVDVDQKKVRESRGAFLSIIDVIKADKAATRSVERALNARLSKAEPVEMAKAIIKATASKDVRDTLAEILPATPEREAAMVSARGKVTDFVSVADELRKAAKSFYNNLDGQIEVPGGSRRRDMMREVSQSVLGELQKDHPHLTMADFQALMWYPEKTLYDSAGADNETSDSYEDDEAPDYANAAIALAREQGVPNADIDAAVERARSDIDSRQRARRSGRATGGVSPQDQAGAGGDTAPDAGQEIKASQQRIVGDSGRPYTPEQKTLFQNVGRTIEVPTLKERIAELRKDLGKRITQGVVDQFAPIKDLTKDGYLLARLSKGAAGAIEAFMQHGKLSINGGVYDADRSGGVLDRVFKPLQGEAEDFLWWVAGNRAERLAKEDRENLFTPKDIAAAKSLDNGTTGFDYVLQHGPNAGKTTRDRTLIYRDALKTFDEFNKNAMDMAEQSGLINKESRQYWEHEFYVPFYRVSEDTGGFVGGNIGKGLVRQQAFKQLKGGTDKLNSDLLANTLQNWSHLIDAAAKNRAAKVTLEAAANHGIAVEAPQSTIQQMGKAGGKAVWFMDDGVQRHFLVDPQHSDLLDAVNSLQFAGLRGPIMDALSGFKHWLTVGVTASPFFKIRNLIRDSMQAVAVSPLSYNPATNFRQGLAASSRESQTYVSSLASGGLIRFGTMLEGNASERVRQLVRMGVEDSTILNSPDKIQAVLDKFRKGFMAYSEIGNRGEEINRAALYDQLVKSGVSHAEASLMARDLMDFSMQGSWASVRFLTQVVPFMNARLQGLYKLGKGAKEDKARFATVLGAVGAFSLLLMAMYHDDDDWKKREDWDRNNNWWFKVGGIAYRIPKPFEIGAMATLAERGVELFANDEMTKQRFLKQVLTLVGDNLSMNPIPQAVKPVLDIYANKDSFSGRPIESMGMERLAPDYRFNSRTSMIARGLGTAGQSVLNATGLSKIGVQSLSPVQIDHLIQGYFSWLGAFAVGGADMLVRPMTNEPTRPAADMFKLASGGMVAQVDSASSRYVSDVYEQAKVLEQAYGTWRSLIKQNKVAEAREFFADNKDQIARYRMVEKVKAGEAKFNEMIRMIERSDLPPDAKRERINLIRVQQDRMARVLVPQ